MRNSRVATYRQEDSSEAIRYWLHGSVLAFLFFMLLSTSSEHSESQFIASMHPVFEVLMYIALAVWAVVMAAIVIGIAASFLTSERSRR